MHNRSWCCWR